jgi:epsilon-lactone hydrolase
MGLGALFICFSTLATAAVDPSAAVSLPAVSIPFSTFASDEARKQFVESMLHPSIPPPGTSIDGTRRFYVVDFKGDSAFVAPILTGQPFTAKPLSAMDLPYFKGVDPNDPMVFPGASGTVLAGYPPTLLITGSRDFAMSSVLRSHALLIQAHVDAELHVYEGMWHGFFINPELPESIAAYSVIVHFFKLHLGR